MSRLTIYFSLGGYLIALYVAQAGWPDKVTIDPLVLVALGIPLAIVLGHVILTIAGHLEQLFRNDEESLIRHVIHQQDGRYSLHRRNLFLLTAARADLLEQIREFRAGLPEHVCGDAEAVRREALAGSATAPARDSYAFAAGVFVATLIFLAVGTAATISDGAGWFFSLQPLVGGVLVVIACLRIRNATSWRAAAFVLAFTFAALHVAAFSTRFQLLWAAAAVLPFLLHHACVEWLASRRALYRRERSAAREPEPEPEPAVTVADTTESLYSLRRSSSRKFHARDCKYVVDEPDSELDAVPKASVPRAERCSVCR